MELTPEAREARRVYMKEYRARMSADKQKQRRIYDRKWRREHPEATKAINARYWNKRAQKMNSDGEDPGKD